MTPRAIAWSWVVVIAGVAAAAGQAPDTAAQVDRGRRAFMRVGCYECHGREAQGASTGPRLGPGPIPFDAFARAVRAPRNEMPPYGAPILSDDDLADIYAFVGSRPAPRRAAPLPPSLRPHAWGGA